MTECAVTTALDAARAAVGRWRETPVMMRARIIGAVRPLLAQDMASMLDCMDWGRSDEETVAAEMLPLLDAVRFLERHAARILKPRAPVGRRPAWLMGVRAEIRREPFGVVLVLAPGNYPLFLPGVQLLQALAAGNAVCVKPAPGRAPPVVLLAALLREAGLPEGLLHVLDASTETGEAAVRAGFDKIFLTGSAATGARVLAAAAPTLTPSTMELSGNDPVFVLPGADLRLVADCLIYGLRLNRGETCIAPRRVFVTEADAPTLERELAQRLPRAGRLPIAEAVRARVARVLDDPDANGIRILARDGPVVLAGAAPAIAGLTDDVFAPVMGLLAVPDMEAALRAASASTYELGAAVFGPHSEACAFAGRVKAGSIVVNDLIVPTADPRLPFGGRRRSGFGVTRGTEGLLEMTTIQTVSARTGRFRPHLRLADRVNGGSAGRHGQVAALVQALHGRGRVRAQGLATLMRSVRR